MVIKLIFSFSRRLTLTFAIHLGHLLKTVKHGSNDPLILRIDILANVEFVATLELRLDSSDEELKQIDRGQYRSTINVLDRELTSLLGRSARMERHLSASSESIWSARYFVFALSASH